MPRPTAVARPFRGVLALLISWPLLFVGCASPRSGRIDAFVYESPRIDGYGWSMAVSSDGVGMVQQDADPEVLVRLPPDDLRRLFAAAEGMAQYQYVVVNVVGVQCALLSLHADEGVTHISWDEYIDPAYGFTSPDHREGYDISLALVLDWFKLKTLLAYAASSPEEPDPDARLRLSPSMRATIARWDRRRPYWRKEIDGPAQDATTCDP